MRKHKGKLETTKLTPETTMLVVTHNTSGAHTFYVLFLDWKNKKFAKSFWEKKCWVVLLVLRYNKRVNS